MAGRGPAGRATQHRAAEEERFTQDFALLLERDGLPRMAGRILARLLVADAPCQSSAELAQALRASRASISTMTRLLIQAGFLERTSLRGKRGDYFRLRPIAWSEIVRERLRLITEFRDQVQRALRLLGGRDPDRRRWLEDARDLYDWFDQEMPTMLERWERSRRGRRR